MGVFAEPVQYTPAVGAPFTINGVFDEGSQPLTVVDPQAVNAVLPRLGIRLSEFPSGYDPRDAQDDRFTVIRTGVTYVVRDGRPDSHGWAMLEAHRA